MKYSHLEALQVWIDMFMLSEGIGLPFNEGLNISKIIMSVYPFQKIEDLHH
jgi:hypothetical protein